MYRGHVGLRLNQAAKTQMTVVTTIATNDNDVEEDGCMRLPKVYRGMLNRGPKAISGVKQANSPKGLWLFKTDHFCLSYCGVPVAD
jgi:hypothetical protein